MDDPIDFAALGFIAHDGGSCPVAPESYVEPLIRTAEGLGSAGVCKAAWHEWESSKHPDGIGAVVMYRPAERGQEAVLDLTARHPEA